MNEIINWIKWKLGIGWELKQTYTAWAFGHLHNVEEWVNIKNGQKILVYKKRKM